MKNENEIITEWEPEVKPLTEAEWAEIWKKEHPEICQYNVGELVDFYGKRCKIIENTGIDKHTGDVYYLVQVIDDREQSFTWWATERELKPWTGKKNTKCECGALHTRGWETFHAVWCPSWTSKE
jgi:hypothetical protein